MYLHLKQLRPTASLVTGNRAWFKPSPPKLRSSNGIWRFSVYDFYTWMGSQLHDQAAHIHTNSSKATGKVHKTITTGTQSQQTCQSIFGAIFVYRQPCNMSNVKSDWFQLASCCDPPTLPHLHKWTGNMRNSSVSKDCSVLRCDIAQHAYFLHLQGTWGTQCIPQKC